MVEKYATLAKCLDTYTIIEGSPTVTKLLGIPSILDTICFANTDYVDVEVYTLAFDCETDTVEDYDNALQLLSENLTRLLKENAVTVMGHTVVTFDAIEGLPTELHKAHKMAKEVYSKLQIV